MMSLCAIHNLLEPCFQCEREKAMTPNDELLARLDKSNTWSSILDLSDRCRDAAAAIRDLTAKLEATTTDKGCIHSVTDPNCLSCAKRNHAHALGLLEAERKAREEAERAIHVQADDARRDHAAKRELLDRATAAESRLAAVFDLLKRWLDHHTKSAGMTPEIVADQVAFTRFLDGIDKREAQLISDTKSALAPEESQQPSGSDSPK